MKPLRVALPLGIGDCHWACQKLRGLSEAHNDRPIHAHVNRSVSHQTKLYLEMVPFVEKAVEDPKAPYDIGQEMGVAYGLGTDGYTDQRWSRLEGCRDWKGFDYILVANGHLQRGERIETWLPEIETDYTYPLKIPAKARKRAESWTESGQIVLYPSGIGPNHGFHADTWRVADWVAVIDILNREGLEPALVGAATPDDHGYRDLIVRGARGLRYTDLVGRTSHADVMAVIERAGVWCGLNSGLGIVAAMRGTPTVMLWSDSRYQISGACVALHTNMRTSWLADWQLETYRTLSFGSPELTPRAVVHQILEVRRSAEAVAA